MRSVARMMRATQATAFVMVCVLILWQGKLKKTDVSHIYGPVQPTNSTLFGDGCF